MQIRSDMCDCKTAETRYKTGKAAMMAAFKLSNLWSWRESNPRPNIFPKSFLHAYFCIDLSELGRGRTNQPRSYPFRFSLHTHRNHVYLSRYGFDSAAGDVVGHSPGGYNGYLI